MSLKDSLAEGRVHTHVTNAVAIGELLRVVDRDLGDAAVPQLSADRRFATAYNAALQLATIALNAHGYRAAGGLGNHQIILQSLPEIMGAGAQARADYLDACRAKRNLTDYRRSGVASESEAAQLLEEAKTFKTELLAWLRAKHPHLVPKGS